MRRWLGCACLGSAVIIFGIGLLVYLWLPTALGYLRYGYADLPEFMERRIATIDGHEASFLVSKFSSAEYRWGFANDPSAPRTVHDWRQHLGGMFVINGSYFNAKNTPTGFYSIDGAQSIVPWPDSAFDENGYTFAVNVQDGKMNLYFVPVSSMLGPYPGSTFLSFPTLLMNDVPMVAVDSGLHARRTVLAQTDDGVVYVFTSEVGEVSLYQMAQWLAAQPEHFRIAGNLDGGPSTGVSTSSTPWDVDIHSAAIPNVVWVGKN